MSPDCLFVIKHYNDYISNELEADKVERVEKHLRECPNCETFLRQTKAFHSKAISLLRIPAPPTLKESISALFEKN